MSPPSYADLGKAARDVFGKGYHFGSIKLDCKSKTEAGVEVNTGGTHAIDSGKVAGNLETKYACKEYGKGHAVKRKKCHYDDDRMEKAIHLIVTDGVSVSEISKRFSIPRSTLRTRLRSTDPLVLKKPGMSTALSEQEEVEICEWMLRMSKMGHPKAWKTLALAVKDVLDKMGRQNVFKNNNTPTSGWLQAFKRRHPIIKGIKTRDCMSSKNKLTKEAVRTWFKGLRDNISKENLDPEVFMHPNNARRIFYAEEMRVLLQGEDRLSKVLVRREASNTRKMVSIMACMNATGFFTKPLLVYNSKRPPAWQEHPELNPASFDVGFSPSGRIEENVFLYWMEMFVLQLNEMQVEKPVLLLLYYNTADVTIATLEMAKEAGILLHMLPPRPTHLLQPMNYACLKPLKESYRESVEFFAPRYGPSINVKLFPLVFMRAFQRIAGRQEIVDAFRNAGLLPIDANKIISKRMSNKPDSLTNATNVDTYTSSPSLVHEPNCSLQLQSDAQPVCLSVPNVSSIVSRQSLVTTEQSAINTQEDLEFQGDSMDVESFNTDDNEEHNASIESKSNEQCIMKTSPDFIDGMESAMNFVVENFVPEEIRPIYEEWLREGRLCTPDPMFHVWRRLKQHIEETKLSRGSRSARDDGGFNV